MAAEYLDCGQRPARIGEKKICGGQRWGRCQIFADAADEAGPGGQAHRQIGAQAQDSFAAGHRQIPESRQPHQCCGCVGRTAADPGRDRKLLVEMQLRAPAWVDRGVHLDEAIKMLQRATEQKPDDGFIIDSLAWAYYRLKQYDKAVLYQEKAVALEPGDPVLNDHLGDIYWKVGRHNEARFQWQRALAFKPEADQVKPIEAKLQHGLDVGGTGG